MPRRRIRRQILCLLPLFAATLVQEGSFLCPAARAEDGSAVLSVDSPFVAPGGHSMSPAPEGSTELELRGIMSTDEGYRYCVYDSKRGKGVWVAQNEEGPGFTITTADPARETVTVARVGDLPLTLALRESKVVSDGQRPGEGLQWTEAGPARGDRASGPISAEFSLEVRSRLSPAAQAALLRADLAERERLKAAAEQIGRRSNRGPPQ